METKQKYKQTQKKFNKNQKRAQQHSQTQPINQSTYSLRFKSQETTNRNEIASNNSSSNQSSTISISNLLKTIETKKRKLIRECENLHK